MRLFSAGFGFVPLFHSDGKRHLCSSSTRPNCHRYVNSGCATWMKMCLAMRPLFRHPRSNAQNPRHFDQGARSAPLSLLKGERERGSDNTSWSTKWELSGELQGIVERRVRDTVATKRYTYHIGTMASHSSLGTISIWSRQWVWEGKPLNADNWCVIWGKGPKI